MNDQQQQQQQIQQQITQRMKSVGKIIAIMSNKGGVGKSTVAVNMAAEMARRGKRVGLLDTDLHGPSDTKMLGIDKNRIEGSEDNLIPLTGPFGMKIVSVAALMQQEDAPLIWRGPIKANLIRQFLAQVEWGELDYLCIDSPPGTGDEPLSVLQFLSAIAGVVIVTTPQEVATLDVRKAITFARKLDAPVLGIVENMSVLTCPHCGEHIELFGRGGGSSIASRYNIPLLGSLPFDPAVGSEADKGKTIAQSDRTAEAKTHMSQVVDALMQQQM